MPRVRPTRSRFEDSDLVRSWQAFSFDDDLGAHTIRRGVRLHASHPAVKHRPDCFVLASEADDAEPSPYPDVPVETPMFEKPTQVRLKTRVLRSSMTFEPGTVAEFPADVAEWLVTENFAEITCALPAPPITAGATGAVAAVR
jgi:hypothetical protein